MVQKSRKIAAKMVQNRGLEEAWAALGAYRSVLVASWGFLGAFWGVLGTSWGVLGGVLGASWGVLGVSWGSLKRLLGPPRASWGVLGRLGLDFRSKRYLN